MIPTSGKIGICEVCGSEAEMTWDHIVPKWFIEVVSRLNVNWKKIVETKELNGKLWRRVCSACNFAKGGQIDYRDPIVRLAMKGFLLAIYENLKIYEGPRKVVAVCMCKEHQPAFDKINKKPDVISSIEAHAHRHWPGVCWCGHIQPGYVKPEEVSLPVREA